jgi:hypothetical protein
LLIIDYVNRLLELRIAALECWQFMKEGRQIAVSLTVWILSICVSTLGPASSLILRKNYCYCGHEISILLFRVEKYSSQEIHNSIFRKLMLNLFGRKFCGCANPIIGDFGIPSCDYSCLQTSRLLKSSVFCQFSTVFCCRALCFDQCD